MSSRLSPQFRKWSIAERRNAVAQLLASSSLTRAEISLALGPDGDLCDLADVMVESAVGYEGLPLGICRGLLLDEKIYDIPMVTEEPSVIAAATYAAGIIGRHGGFTSWADEPVITGQVFIEGASPDAEEAVPAAEPEILAAIAPTISRMEQRGGGFRGMDVKRLPRTGLLRIQIHLDVRNAMGANIVNTAAEAARPVIERVSGGKCLMAILTNVSDNRRAGARFAVPVQALRRSGMDGAEVARRVVLASNLASEDPSRAVTHNKGVMNGITALMLATGNDTRAVEAAAHSHAARSGHYGALAVYELNGEVLEGRIELPMPVGTVGGAAGIHPTTRLALALLGNPDAGELARVAAAVGLAQNLAALMALVTEGIQTGHMAMHARRLAWQAGARGEERVAVEKGLVDRGIFNMETAAELLSQIRAGSGS